MTIGPFLKCRECDLHQVGISGVCNHCGANNRFPFHNDADKPAANFGAELDTATKDQIASLMLQHGTEAQQKEAIEYAFFKPAAPDAMNVLRRIKLRLHFMDWPTEPFWNAGTKSDPKWIADWRYEIALIEHALHGSAIDAPEKPTDTKPAHEVNKPAAPDDVPELVFQAVKTYVAQLSPFIRDEQHKAVEKWLSAHGRAGDKNND